MTESTFNILTSKDSSDFPYVPKDLLEALESEFPNELPFTAAGASLETIAVETLLIRGARKVISFLKTKMEEQEE